jgi:NAD(P)-dependent dehydrogenase (short-subunit alcohol dehydrogenase family)
VILTDRQVTAEGFEATFGVNHLGHFLLTSLLVDRLRASAPSRIVNVASFAHRLTRNLDFDDLQREHGYSGTPVYNQSKLANVLFTRELARRLEGSGVSVFAVHPGTVRTGWGQEGDTSGATGLGLKLIRPLLIGPKTGAASTIYAASEPGIESESGAYYQRVLFGNYGPVRKGKTSSAARDDAGARRLWELSEELIASVPA